MNREQLEKISDFFKKVKEQSGLQSEGLDKIIDSIEKLNSNFFAKTASLLMDNEFVTLFVKIIETTAWKKFIVAQIIGVILILLIKSSFVKKARTWIERIGMELMSLFSYIMLSSVVIPWIFIGPPYFEIILKIYKTYA